ncbi:MAG: cytochrome c3 family protein [Bacteroidales bacterium]|nr:cytochrome c3 family protein [Bacteroidales bacterium]
MKSMRLIFTLVLVASFATIGMGQTIVGTLHDFSLTGWADEICIACHTPHDGDQTVLDAPLWNHEVTTQAFIPYSGTGTLNATVGQPDGVSKLCLSCHDGVTNMDAFGGAVGTIAMTGQYVTGLDLSNDHPVSFTYDAALVALDPGLHPTTTTTPLGGTIAEDMLFNGQMECASCHDVHNSAGIASLLLMSNAASALCLTCHNK